MSAAVTKKQIESVLADRWGNIFERYTRPAAETLQTGINGIDRVLNGLPRGTITEIHGDASSGRISLLLSILATASSQEETCAIIDCWDSFDLSSATKAGVDFNRVLWVRCQKNLEHAFKAVDLVLHGGGFGLVALNLCDVPATAVRRIITSWWFRFRRAIQDTPTALIILTPLAALRSCAALVLDLKKEKTVWRSTLSLISENRNDSFTDKKQQIGHLALVPAAASDSSYLVSKPHAYFLYNLQIRVNLERPLQWQPNSMMFHPHH